MTTFANITQDIDEERVRCLICSALEGGSNHWYLIEEYQFPEGITRKDFFNGGRFTIPGHDWHPAQLVPFVQGCAVIFSVPEDDDGKTYMLDRDALTRGLKVMSEKYPQHWANFIGENDDADTGDVFLQCALFGELVYC